MAEPKIFEFGVLADLFCIGADPSEGAVGLARGISIAGNGRFDILRPVKGPIFFCYGWEWPLRYNSMT